MIKPKLKRGTCHNHNGIPVYVELDAGGESVLISTSILRHVTDSFEWVLREALTPERKVARNGLKTPRMTDKKKEDSLLMSAFFRSLEDKLPVNCMECGQPLQVWNTYARRSVSAHILPKSKFESVARNEDNILYMGAAFLGGCAHHDDWDSSVEKRKAMKIYPQALKQFDKFKDQLTDKELIDALKYLGL